MWQQKTYECFQIRKGSALTHPHLRSALCCFLYLRMAEHISAPTDKFRDAVSKAVNLGYDTDTTGAITGGLAALLYGEDSIPQDWITQLKKPEFLEDLRSRNENYSASGSI